MTMKGILYKTLIMVIIGLVWIFGVLTEGSARVFGKFTKYLEQLHDVLITHLEHKNLMGKYASTK